MMSEGTEFKRDLLRAGGKAQKKTDAQKHRCLFPGCKNNAISSHSQQRGGQLRAISQNGEVYSMEKNLYKAMKRKPERGLVHFKKTPISKASIFPGFCSEHDSKLFAPIEKTKLTVGNKHQAALFFLRSNSFEYLQKRQAVMWNQHFMEQVGVKLHSDAIENYRLKMYGMFQYLQTDAPHYFERAFESVTSKEQYHINTAWVEIPKNIMVSTSCCFSPLMHMHTEYMMENLDDVQPAVSFNVVPNAESTHVIVSWLKEHDDIANWFKDALNDNEELELLINQLSFGETEDTCISPDLWENLEEDERLLISKAVGHSRIIGEPAPLPRVICL